MNLFRRLFFIASISLVLCSCNKVGEGIFGDWWPYDKDNESTTSKGTTFKILQDRGDFSLFLSALERTEYDGVVNGAGLVTLFAPTDAAFTAFLNAKGYGSLDNVPIDSLELLVTFHMIRYAYSREDFLAFSVNSTSENPVIGDGTAFRYKTYARKPISDYQDPVTGSEYILYHKEEWLPVMSSRLFTKDSDQANAKADYETLFPEGSWTGQEDYLYVADAKVIEAGIPTDNGYLNIIDKVVEPMPTIYEELAANRNPVLENRESRLTEDYKLFALIVQTLNYYKKDNDATKLYGQLGEEISLLWTLGDRSEGANTLTLPAIASEFTYNNDNGVNLTNSMSYAVTALIPTDEVLTDWFKEHFGDWLEPEESVENLIRRLPYMHLYLIASAHLYDRQNLRLPSQLENGFAGIYGEYFQVDQSNVVENVFCSNGIVYGINKVLTSPIFEDNFLSPLLLTPSNGEEDKTYNWYAVAFLSREFYRTGVSGSGRYTLFVRSDATQRAGNNTVVEGMKPSDRFIPQITVKGSSGNETNITEYLNESMIREIMPDPASWQSSDGDYIRFYLSNKQIKPFVFLCSYNGSLYTMNSSWNQSSQPVYVPVSTTKIDDYQNGVVYEVDKQFYVANHNVDDVFSVLTVPDGKWKQLAASVDIRPYGWWSAGWTGRYNEMDLLAFVFSDEAVDKGLANGLIPKFDREAPESEAKDEAYRLLKDYLDYYIVDRASIPEMPVNAPMFGLRGDGVTTDEPFSYRMKTVVEHENPADAKYLTMSWDPADPMVFTLTAQNGDKITTTRKWDPKDPSQSTPLLPVPYKSGVIYLIDDVFNYKTMFGN